MTLLHPIWLLLAVPAAVALFVWKPPSRPLLILRAAILTLILLALAGLALKLPSDAGTTVVVADRSLSMPHDAQERQEEAIQLVQNAKNSDSKLAVVAFGKKAAVELPPGARQFSQFNSRVQPDASNLNDALHAALSLIPKHEPGRILLLSDGRWTGVDPAEAAALAAARGAPIDHRAVRRPGENDAAVERIEAPQSVRPGESFMIAAWIRNPLPGAFDYELTRNGETIAAGTRSLQSGLSRILFRDAARQPGVHRYMLRIRSDNEDPVPENNRAKRIVGVEGEKPILHIANTADSGLGRLLRSGRLNVQTRTPDPTMWTLDRLAGYSALLIENVPAQKIGTKGMETIAQWVQETGAGLMMTGGKAAYGPGGYFKSPLEPIMPVSMELRKEHRKLSVAIAVAMDRSGSMGAPASIGRTKMDLANQAAAEVYDMLSPTDQFGAIAVDSRAHIIAEMEAVDPGGPARDAVMRIQPGGGGIYVYNALAAAVRMLEQAEAETRHVLLLADAADSEQPDKYIELIRLSRQAGVTFSVIGLGSETDKDAEFLRDIAQRGEGRIFFTNDAGDLPRLFAQDAIEVARSSFVEEPTAVQANAGTVSLLGKTIGIDRQVGGYNLCYIRPDANEAVQSLDEYKAPILAAWQIGLGRALCYTPEANGRFTGPIAEWSGIGDFLAGMARWTAGESENLPNGAVLTQRLQNGVLNVQLHLDPGRESAELFDPPALNVLREYPQTAPSAEKAPMRWSSPDLIEANIPLDGSETLVAALKLEDANPVALPPVALPYSPEFRPQRAGAGQDALRQTAQISNGKARVNLADIWGDLTPKPRFIPLAPWLLCAAVVLILIETLERRTGMIAGRAFAWPLAERIAKRREARRESREEKRRAKEDEKEERQEIPEPPPEEKRGPGAQSDALQKARQRARRRTQR